MIYILADDLTGASDTGIQYKKAGYETLVKIYNDKKFVNSDKFEVIAVNLDTRALSEEEAYEITADYIKNLKWINYQYIYKKVDSLMRGNPAVELEASMNVLDADIAIVAPSFPENNRVLERGKLKLLDNRIVDLVELFEAKMTRKVMSLNIDTIVKGIDEIKKEIERGYKLGYSVFIMDVLKDQHLRDIKLACDEIDLNKIYCGSAGLAKYLSLDSLESKKTLIERKRNNLSPSLLMVGTRSDKTRLQVERLIEDKKLDLIIIDTDKIVGENKEDEKNKIISRAKEKLARGDEIVALAVEGLFEDYTMSLHISEEEAKNSLLIAEALGEISGEIIKDTDLKTIITTGGDTSLQVCKYLNVSGIELEEEVLPGVPLGKIVLEDNRDLKIVTKSGSFGEDDTLIKVIDYLKGEDKDE